jgi:hypothetical protein
LFSSWLLPVTLRSHLPTQDLTRSCAAFPVAFCFSSEIARRQSLSLALNQLMCHPTLCLPSLPREAGLLFLNHFLLSLRNLPSFLQSLLLKCPSIVLFLPLDHCGLENFLLIFQISSWSEILGGSHVESLEFSQLVMAASSYLCRMCIIDRT